MFNFFNSFFSKVSYYFLFFIKFTQQFLIFPQFYFLSFWKNIDIFFSPKNFIKKIENKLNKIKISCKKSLKLKLILF